MVKIGKAGLRQWNVTYHYVHLYHVDLMGIVSGTYYFISLARYPLTFQIIVYFCFILSETFMFEVYKNCISIYNIKLAPLINPHVYIVHLFEFIDPI
jgi:hypothetical protein